MRIYFILLLFCSLIQPGIAQVNLDQGLLAHYPFSGNVLDFSGNSNNGTVYGPTLTAGRDGLPNTAFRFNGTSDYIQVDDSPGLTAPLMTLCAIIKPEGFYTGQCQGNVIFWKGQNFVPGNYGLHFSDGANNPNCNTIDTEVETFYSHFSDNNGGGFYTPYVALDRWYCLIASYDGDSIRFYIDGALKSVTPVTSPIGVNTEPLVFGHNIWNGQFPYWFNGIMDDVRIYGRVLNPDEIATYSGSAIGIQELGGIPSLQLNTISDGVFHLNFQEAYRNVDLTVYNYLGERMWSGKTNAAGFVAEVDLSGFSSGFYLLDILADGKRATRKLVKN